MEKMYQEHYAKKAYDVDKALFDFDESVDNLSQVSERYIQPNQKELNLIQGEELQSNEEQGKAKDAQQEVIYNDERPSPMVEQCASRKEISRQLHRHKSDCTMTPKLTHVRSKGGNMLDQLKNSKISSQDLREEIIKDLSGKNYNASKKQL